uniref:Uncharacterized protein n=1 Tax=Amphimedon queenslandica TaxID=400682 RepID=A0A1X7VA82_AMPQE
VCGQCVEVCERSLSVIESLGDSVALSIFI